jgi:NarL family two-component system response regulator YdfI
MSESSRRVRVVIVDDHLMVRRGLRVLLGEMEDVELIGDAADGAAALDLLEEIQPDVVLMDIRMPGMDGIETMRRILRAWPQIAVLILTTYNEDDLMIQGLRAGARGFLLKDASTETLRKAIQSAARGEMLVQPDMLARILARTAAPMTASVGSMELTEREQAVLEGVARGERSKEIAVRLGISARTVGAHLTSIYLKLQVDSRVSAVTVALERGLLPRQGIRSADDEGESVSEKA